MSSAAQAPPYHVYSRSTYHPLKIENNVLSTAKSCDSELLLAQLGQEGRYFTCRPKHVFFLQGDRSDAVFYIKRGTVKLSVVSGQGKEAVIGILGPNDFLGEACVAGQSLRTASASAVTECSVIRVAKATMIRLLHDRPVLSQIFVAYLLSRNLRVEEDLADQLFNSSEKRLARALLLLARVDKEGTPVSVIPKISQQTLAEMIGTTRSRVSFFMNKFRSLGFIKYKHDLEIHSSLLNVVAYEAAQRRLL